SRTRRGDSGRWTSASSLRQQRALRSRPQRPSVSLMRQRARRRPTRGRRLKDCRWERCSRLRLAFKPRRAPVSSCQRARGGGASPCPPARRYRLGKPVRREGRGSRVSESVISVSELTRRFGAATALDSVSVSLPRGAVYGLVGANGAGKTTLIRHVLGLLRAESGSVRVFGLDPVADPVAVLSRIGYLSEENDLPGWMRVDELMRYSRAFYPAWDDAYAEELRRTFALDRAATIKKERKSTRARAGLLIALAYRPERLVLDEPSSGLDPIVRRDILGAVIRTIADEGRTVLYSSHLPNEVVVYLDSDQ